MVQHFGLGLFASLVFLFPPHSLLFHSLSLTLTLPLPLPLPLLSLSLSLSLTLPLTHSPSPSPSPSSSSSASPSPSLSIDTQTLSGSAVAFPIPTELAVTLSSFRTMETHKGSSPDLQGAHTESVMFGVCKVPGVLGRVYDIGMVP